MSDVTFIDLLKDEYRSAVAGEKQFRKDYETASTLLGNAVKQKNLIGELLLSKGIDPASVVVVDSQSALSEPPPPVSNNGHSPAQTAKDVALSNTHAVYLAMRERENEWIAIKELPTLTQLTSAQVSKVLARQIEKKRMERDRTKKRVRQTALGVGFDNFREQKTEE